MSGDDEKVKNAARAGSEPRKLDRRDILKGLSTVPALGLFGYAWQKQSQYQSQKVEAAAAKPASAAGLQEINVALIGAGAQGFHDGAREFFGGDYFGAMGSGSILHRMVRGNHRPIPGSSAKPVKAAAPVGSASPASQQGQAANSQPTQPTPEPARVTIPEGTAITIRLIDPVDSEKNKEGDTFSASLDSPIVIDDKTIIPKNADVEARLVSAKSAGHFTGSSAVGLVLSKITFGGKTYDVQTGEFTKQSASRGKRSAMVIGGGAAVGAVIGAIAGGGKGAAIGAAAGAGTGTGVQALTKSEQIKLPSETLLEFQLKAPLTVTPASDTVKRETVG